MRNVALLLLVGLSLLGGCAQIRVTDPPRTATEQFLISQASAQAVAQLSTGPLRDRVVYIDAQHFLPARGEVTISDGPLQDTILDRQYLLGSLRAHLLLNGVRLAPAAEEAQIVLELRSAAIGIDRLDYLLGVPPVLIPATNAGPLDVEDSGTLVTPEIAFLKNIRQTGYASVAYVAYWRDSGEIVANSGPFVGKTYRSDWWYFGVGPRTSGDIPPAEEDE